MGMNSGASKNGSMGDLNLNNMNMPFMGNNMPPMNEMQLKLFQQLQLQQQQQLLFQQQQQFQKNQLLQQQAKQQALFQQQANSSGGSISPHFGMLNQDQKSQFMQQQQQQQLNSAMLAALVARNSQMQMQQPGNMFNQFAGNSYKQVLSSYDSRQINLLYFFSRKKNDLGDKGLRSSNLCNICNNFYDKYRK